MGKHLSPAQEAAVELTLIREERLHVEDFVDRFKMALVSHDPDRWIEKMYPNWVRQPEQIIEDEDSMDLNDTEGEWVFTDTVTPEEAEREFQALLAQRGGTLTMDDLPDDEGWV